MIMEMDVKHATMGFWAEDPATYNGADLRRLRKYSYQACMHLAILVYLACGSRAGRRGSTLEW